MPNYLSTLTADAYFKQIKYHLPISKRSDDTAIQNWINTALSRYNKLYVDNNKGIYDVIEVKDFYTIDNAPPINVRGLGTSAETRWCLTSPANFYASKLVSCMLKEILPVGVVLPVDIEYIQDITISILTAGAVNTAIPSVNKGSVAVVGGRQLMSVLTLDNTGTPFQNIQQITAFYTYYRNVIYPSWASPPEPAEYIDILEKDVELTAHYVVEEAYLPNKSPLSVVQAIQNREFEIVYN